DALLWATHAAAPEWPRAAGINVTDSGFIAVNRFLQSTSHDFIYAAGDVAEMIGNPRPKNGVFAVRQGRPLAQNLRLALSGFHPRPYRPQRSFLSLISTGNRNAIASKGPWAAAGGWVWHWKQRIDRKWMHQYRELPKMEISQAEMDFTARMKKNLKTTDHKGREEKPRMRCGGCGAKVGGLILHEALRQLKQPANPAVVVGLAAPDDAAVLTVPAGRPLVQSVDFFPSLINDPHLFGRIAANHALNDLHAKGATPFAALATAMLPPAKDWILIDQLSHLLAGAGKQLNADQATLVGGHSSEGRELGLGLTVTGTVPSTRILRKTGLAPGDLLILTKPLGTGVLFAADMDLKLSATWLATVVNGMLVSNAAAAAVFVRAGVRACTDISGFGLLGHLREMLVHGDAGLELWPDSIPTYPGTRQLLAEAVSSSMVPANAYNLSLLGPGPWDLTPERTLLLDPQTAGGLLAGVSEETASSVLEELRTAGYPEAAIIGRVMAKGTGPHVVLGKP
ncbi:MAG TPA: selenide, water dikinase SelD, partial [Verrucomicrobiales bacterium]|nr:selenide, water dikinase SelD [Verrucomicrobiales bacterium]